MNSPKVLFIAPSAYLWGGVQTWLDQTAAGLRERGWEVVLALAAGPIFHDPSRYAEEHRGHRIVPVECRTGTPEGRCRAILRTLEAERPDVMVIVNVADGLEAGRRWKARPGNPSFRLAYSIHGFLPGQLADLAAYGGVVDRIVTTNRLTEQIVVEILGESPERVGYAPYGAEAPRVPPSMRPPEPRPLRLGWAGRLEEPQKRARDLVGILRGCLARGVEFTCDVAGDGDSREILRDELRELVSAGRVRFLGRLSREELYGRFYPGLDVLLLTSSWETGPIVAWEAMRHEAALVSTRYVGVVQERALESGVNCLLAPVGDTAGLAESVRQLSANGCLLQRLAKNGRALAEMRYSIEASADAWDRELRRTFASPARREPLDLPPRTISGRLDRRLDPGAAEWLRELLGRSARPEDPGDEWPHQLMKKSVPLAPIEDALAALLRSTGQHDSAGREVTR